MRKNKYPEDSIKSWKIKRWPRTRFTIQNNEGTNLSKQQEGSQTARGLLQSDQTRKMRVSTASSVVQKKFMEHIHRQERRS